VTSIVKAEIITPFANRPPISRTFWQRLFRRPSTESAAVDAENLLATKSPGEIGPADLSRITMNHHLTPADLRAICVSLWRRAVASAVSDNLITDGEAAWLSSLRKALQVTDAEAREVEAAVIHPRYQAKVSEVLADGFLSPTERTDLDRLTAGLRISKEDYAALYWPVAQAALGGTIGSILEDHRVSPQEFTDFAAKAKSMGIDPTLSADTEAQMRRYAEFWRIENGELPLEADAGITLQKGETCHYTSSSVTWAETRTRTTRTNLGSVGYNFRIARGVYYRSPRVRLPSVKEEVPTILATGQLYITN
jgi:hypothetical protein